jgi:hypothetical protein
MTRALQTITATNAFPCIGLKFACAFPETVD